MYNILLTALDFVIARNSQFIHAPSFMPTAADKGTIKNQHCLIFPLQTRLYNQSYHTLQPHNIIRQMPKLRMATKISSESSRLQCQHQASYSWCQTSLFRLYKLVVSILLYINTVTIPSLHLIFHLCVVGKHTMC